MKQSKLPTYFTILLVGLAPVIFFSFSIHLFITDISSFKTLCEEDGIIENMQAIFFFLGSLLSLFLAWMLKKDGLKYWAIFYGLLGVLLFLATGEEISWGQRIFRVATPNWYAGVNAQHETNLHNLKGVMGVISWSIDHTLFNLILLAFFGWFYANRISENLQPQLWLPHPVLLPYWACFYARRGFEKIYASDQILVPGDAFSKLQEPVELIMASSIVVFLVIIFKRYSALKKERYLNS